MERHRTTVFHIFHRQSFTAILCHKTVSRSLRLRTPFSLFAWMFGENFSFYFRHFSIEMGKFHFEGVTNGVQLLEFVSNSPRYRNEWWHTSLINKLFFPPSRTHRLTRGKGNSYILNTSTCSSIHTPVIYLNI